MGHGHLYIGGIQFVPFVKRGRHRGFLQGLFARVLGVLGNRAFHYFRTHRNVSFPTLLGRVPFHFRTVRSHHRETPSTSIVGQPSDPVKHHVPKCPALVTQSALAKTTPTRKRLLAASLLALAGVVGMDALLFRTRLYPSVLEPVSAAGEFELTLRRERLAQTRFGGNCVTGVGDSRFAYYPRLANELMAETGLYFRSAGVAGTTPQAWYYMLRDLDPSARRYRAIMIGVNDYDDEDQAYELDADLTVLHYVIVRLRLTDLFDFAGTFHGLSYQWRAFRGALLKGITLQSDILAFLTHPRDRIDAVHLHHNGFDEWTYNYVESDKTVAGVNVDWSHLTITYPPGADPIQRETLHNWLLHPPDPPQNRGRVAAYRRAWFGRIIDRYRGSRTKIIIVRLPRGPIVRPRELDVRTSSSVRELAARPNVLLCGEHAFESLERPELFKDGLHLNREGAALFSHMLA